MRLDSAECGCVEVDGAKKRDGGGRRSVQACIGIEVIKCSVVHLFGLHHGLKCMFGFDFVITGHRRCGTIDVWQSKRVCTNLAGPKTNYFVKVRLLWQVEAILVNINILAVLVFEAAR